nr:hypothetical protein [Tanacetum cinerariifolium]
MFTRSIVIQRRVEDLQLGVESYQKMLNLTKTDMYRSDLKHKEAYIAYSNLRGFIYHNKDKKNRLMRIDELHKFNDGTLTDVRTTLDDQAEDQEDHEELGEVCRRKVVRWRLQDATKDHMIYHMLFLSFKRSILTDLQVTPTKSRRMTNPYSSHRFIANCFNAGNLKIEESQYLWNVDIEDIHVYKIISANRNTSYHKSLSSMLKKFNRQDLVDLHRLMMKKFKDNTPEGYNLLLWGDLKNKLVEQMTSICEMVDQLIQKKQEEKQIQEDQAANTRYWKIPAYYDDDDDYNFPITPNETIDSLNMGDVHLDTVPVTESDKFIKSSVENLVPNLSESEGENSCDLPTCFTTFLNIIFDAEYEFDSIDNQSLHNEDFPREIFSNPLFEEEINSMRIGQHHFNADSDLIASLFNHDSSIIPCSSKIDSLLDEFTGELTLLKSIPSGIDETDYHPENEIRLSQRLLYDNSSPRPPKEFVSENSNADDESFSPSTIMEEINLTFTPDGPMPPSIEEDDDDSRDILILEELLYNYSLPIPKNESFHFDVPLSSRPPAKPP